MLFRGYRESFCVPVERDDSPGWHKKTRVAGSALESLAEEVVVELQLEVDLEGLVVNFVLERLLARLKGGADVAHLGLVGRRTELGRQLGLERPPADGWRHTGARTHTVGTGTGRARATCTYSGARG